MHSNHAISALALLALTAPSTAQVFTTGDPVPGISQLILGGGLALADINGDGHLDLASVHHAANGLPEQTVALGNGTGGFGASTSTMMPAGGLPWLFINLRQDLQDVDGDGFPDLIFGAQLGGTGIFYGGSDDVAVRTARVPEISFAMFADFNGDDIPDCIGRAGGFGLPERHVIALGTGNGTFGSFADMLPDGTALPALLTPVLTGDWNADGNLDVFLSGLLGSFLLLGDGTGRFSLGTSPLGEGFARPRFATDFNGDGHLDVAVETPGALEVLFGDGSGNFSAATPSAPSGRWSALVDVTGDGRMDLVGSLGGMLAVVPGSVTGGFDAPILHPEPAGILVAGDVDGDGDVDLVAFTGTIDEPARVLRNVFEPPTGSTAFGTGTPTCGGTIGMVASRAPVLGDQDFGIRCSNAPPDSLGLMLAGIRNSRGWDPLGIDLTLHLFVGFPIGEVHSDLGGAALFSLPIPANPGLNGIPVSLQSIWMGDAGAGNTCSPALFELASSRGLTIRLRR